MQAVEFDAVRILSEDFYRVAKQFPEARQTLVREVGQAMLNAVRGGFGGTGTVQSWQEKYLGSKGGYAAVRPQAKMYQSTLSGKRYAVGYITNAIDNGHGARGPGGYAKRYRPRVRKTRIPGKGAYDAAAAQVESIAVQAGEQVVERLAAEMGG